MSEPDKSWEDLVLPDFVETAKEWWLRNCYPKDMITGGHRRFNGRWCASAATLRSSREFICQVITDIHGLKPTRYFKPKRGTTNEL